MTERPHHGDEVAAEDVFADALEVPPEERDAFVEARCPDVEVLTEVRSLLDAHARADDFLDDRPDRAEEDLSGTTLGPWRLEREIGSGGMGRVYLGERAGDGFAQRAAIKVIKRGMDTDDVLRRFRRERRLLAGLEHPGIARLLDGGATPDGRPWLAMAYVENGVPIDAYADQGGLDLAARIELVIQACHAVHAAHQSLVVHRDIKPGNLLVTPAGRVTLLDFGIARLLDDAAAGAATTAGPRRFLTPAWASPEQLRGERVTTAGDVHALGILLFRLLTGAMPWDEAPRDAASRPVRPSTRLQTMSPEACRAAAARRLVTPSTWRRALRGDLDAIVMRALAPRPEDRYASAAALADDLARHLAHEPVAARPGGLAYRARKLVRRRPVAAAIVLASLLTITGGLAITSAALVAVHRSRAAEREALALAQSEQATSAAIIDYLRDLLTAPDPFVAGADPGAARDVRVLDVVRRNAAALDGRTFDDPLVEAGVRQLLGRTFQSLGEHADAETHLRRAVALHASSRGPDHPWTLTSKLLLGNVRQELGDLDEAERLYREVADGRRRTLGPDHEETVIVEGNLSLLLQRRDRRDEARPLAERVLAWRREHLDPAHPDLLRALSNLGLILYADGAYDAAERLFREEVDLSRAAFPPGHPQLLLAINNLAFCLHAQDALDEAGALLEESLEGSRRTLGPTHGQTLLVTSNLGAIREAQGRLDEAAALYEASYEARRAQFGDGHPNLGVITSNLGNLHRKAGRLERALAFHERALAIHLEHFGPDFFGTGVVRSGYGVTLLELGRLDEAEAMLEASKRILLAERGPEYRYSVQTLEALDELARRRRR